MSAGISKRRRMAVMCSLAAVLIVCSAAHAVGMSVVDSFPAAYGSSVWFPQQYDVTSKTITALRLTGDYAYSRTAAGSLPFVAKTGQAISMCPGERWAVLSFLPLTTGTFDFSVLFSAGSAETTAKVAVYLDRSSATTYLSAPPLFEGLVSGTTSSYFGSGVAIHANDRLRFVVSGLDDPTGDNVLLTDAGPIVPEPGSLAALAAGVVGLVCTRLRKR